MQRLDFVSREVNRIEGKEPSQLMDVHGSNEPCVMHLAAQDVVCDHQALPPFIDRRGIRKQHQRLLDLANFSKRHGNRKTQPVVDQGTGATFQNSAMFCRVKYTASPLASRMATLSTAAV